HNAGAKCNVLTPIASGTASEADWAAAVNRYQTDLEVAAAVPPLCRAIVFVDICELIDVFRKVSSKWVCNHSKRSSESI
ncbi:hypothetical protein ANCCAN_27758, partial [Ancylostoma caninum]